MSDESIYNGVTTTYIPPRINNSIYRIVSTDQSKIVDVPPLTINGPLSPNSNQVYDNTSGSNFSIGLLGRGDPNYGEILQSNIIHLLENFASDISPVNPTDGQLWFNKSEKQLYVFVDQQWSIVSQYDKLVKLDGDTITGTIVFPNAPGARLILEYDPMLLNEAINKRYADLNYIKSSGNSTLSGNLSVTGHISISQPPSTENHVVNKKYVIDTIKQSVESFNTNVVNNLSQTTFLFGSPVCLINGEYNLGSSDDLAHARVIGLCNQPAVATQTLKVQTTGLLTGDLILWNSVVINQTIAGLIPNADYYVDINLGKITANPYNNVKYLTKIGTAISSTTMKISINNPIRM